jgi:hypothetical protein
VSYNAPRQDDQNDEDRDPRDDHPDRQTLRRAGAGVAAGHDAPEGMSSPLPYGARVVGTLVNNSNRCTRARSSDRVASTSSSRAARPDFRR